MSNAVLRVVEALVSRQCSPKQSGKGWSSLCPAHDDRTAGLTVGGRLEGRATPQP